MTMALYLLFWLESTGERFCSVLSGVADNGVAAGHFYCPFFVFYCFFLWENSNSAFNISIISLFFCQYRQKHFQAALCGTVRTFRLYNLSILVPAKVSVFRWQTAIYIPRIFRAGK
jgi:hypothetical protein